MRNLFPTNQATASEQLRAKNERRFTYSLAALQIQMKEDSQKRTQAPPARQADNSGWSHAA
jgi:hypothetical protein